MSPLDFYIDEHWDEVIECRGLVDGFGDSIVGGILECLEC